MDNITELQKIRNTFHSTLLASTSSNSLNLETSIESQESIDTNAAGSVADLLELQLKQNLGHQRLKGVFSNICAQFLEQILAQFRNLYPGIWSVYQVSGQYRSRLAEYEQYAHLIALDRAAKQDAELAAALGSDYTITPDIVVVREAEDDDSINQSALLVDDSVARLSSLRKKNGGRSLLHASISCKWTIRSDRAQNARSEALNLIRNRKGRLPHIVVVTAEPLPSRLAAIALGTGDIDCVYHFALYELQETISRLKMADSEELLKIMVNGKRLKDISDLPLDLAV